jgi:hypothetical protein
MALIGFADQYRCFDRFCALFLTGISASMTISDQFLRPNSSLLFLGLPVSFRGRDFSSGIPPLISRFQLFQSSARFIK